jgi:hypothetical protein
VCYFVSVSLFATYCFLLGALPHTNLVFTFYFGLVTVLLILRLFLYKQKGYHYFLTDWCYGVNLMVLALVYLGDQSSDEWFKACFLCSHGVISFSMWLFKNGLVFNNVDKLTTMSVHFMPTTITYVMRWFVMPQGTLPTI